MSRIATLAACCVILPAAALAQQGGHTVTVTIDSLRSDDGRVTGSLCADPDVPFCSTYVARTVAAGGRAELRFEGVAPGRYALSTVHDVDGDGQTEVPPEGAAFGNNSTVPVFDLSSILVEADMTTSVSMTYPGSGPARMGSQGAPPPDGIVRIDVRDDGLYGELYMPEDADGPLPAVILLDGSNGGLDGVSTLAPAFAREGYAALALAYFAELGLPPTLENIPLEYFDAAVAWLRARPETDGEPVGVLGVSRGAEAALLAGARNAGIGAVIAVAPTHVVWQGYDWADPGNGDTPFTAGGEPLPFLPPDLSLYVPGGPTAPLFVSAMQREADFPETAIRAERINGPILLISGADDEVWPSPLMAERIVARLSGAGFPHAVETLVVPGSHYVFMNSAEALHRSLEFLDTALRDGR